MERKIYRIRRHDESNWVIERFQPGGETITRGKYAGQKTEEKWGGPGLGATCYFPHVRGAVRSLFDTILGEEWPEDGWTGEDLQTAIDRAEARVMSVVSKIETEIPKKESSLVQPGADLTDEQRAEIRDSGNPVLAYLRITGGKRIKRTSEEVSRGLSPKDAVLERVS